MSENVTVELSKQQRDMLLRGLRYVKSSIMLDVHDPTPELNAERSSQLQDVARLADQLNGTRSMPVASEVS